MQRKFIFNGGNSTRYHTFDVHNRQSIGDHSFGVAWFCELITEGGASKSLIMAALAHDLAEHIVGDIPAPAKRALNLQGMFDDLEKEHLRAAGIGNYYASLFPNEKRVLKVSDCMEGLMFCLRERKFGNRNIDVAFYNFTSYIEKIIYDNNFEPYMDTSRKLLSEITAEWKELINDKSQRTSGGGAALSDNVSALGLGQKPFTPVPSSTGKQVSDAMAEKEWASRY